MGCTLGRITGLESPKTIRQDGDRLRLAGEFATTPTAGAVLAQQLVGYPSPDEEVVPFTYDATESGGVLDGFYFVTSTQVDWAKLASGLFSWEAELVAVPTKRTPLFEVSCLGALRDNSHSITTADTYAGTGLPVGVAYPGLSSSNLGKVNRTGADGVVPFWGDGAETLFDGRITYNSTPAAHYLGGAVIEETADSGTTWTPVTGRQINADSPTEVRIGNSLLRVAFTAAGKLTVQHHDGTQWETAKTYYLVNDTSTTQTAWDVGTLTVLRNSPEACALRIGAGYPTKPSVQPYLDVLVARGQRFAEFTYVAPVAGSTGTCGVYRDTAEAATNLTGGIRATSNDIQGNRYVIATPQARTNNLTQGEFVQSSAAGRFFFAIGSEIAGSSAASDDAAQALIYQYHALLDVHQEVVAR